MTNDTITLAANVALTLSFIVAVVFGITQAMAAARDRRERLFLEVLHNYQTRDFAGLLQFVNSHQMPAGREELLALSVDEQVIFMQLAEEMETLGILVAEGFIDMALVDKTLGSFVSTAWEKYKGFVFNERKKQPDPFLSEYFQWLAEGISRRMRARPRKPFHEDGARW